VGLLGGLIQHPSATEDPGQQAEDEAGQQAAEEHSGVEAPSVFGGGLFVVLPVKGAGCSSGHSLGSSGAE
jgi:hypothetical protein